MEIPSAIVQPQKKKCSVSATQINQITFQLSSQFTFTLLATSLLLSGTLASKNVKEIWIIKLSHRTLYWNFNITKN
jgi:hypothetical protein